MDFKVLAYLYSWFSRYKNKKKSGKAGTFATKTLTSDGIMNELWGPQKI